MEPTVDDKPTPAVGFNRDKPQWPMTYALMPLPSDAAPRRWWRHTYYQGPKGECVQVLYGKTKSQSEAIARQFTDEPVLGFDMEWPWDAGNRPRLQDKIALIQLASERKIALFHISLHEGKTVDDFIAPSLKAILESAEIIKAGVAVLSADFKRLREHFNLEPKGAFELSHLYNLLTYDATAPHRSTTRVRSLSLQVNEHLGIPLWKGDVRTSDWSRPLNPSQIQYAATDAYAGFMLFHCMNAKRLAMDPVPPFPRLAEAYLTSILPKSSIQFDTVMKDGEVRIITVHEFYKNIEKEKEADESPEATSDTLKTGDPPVGGEAKDDKPERTKIRKPRQDRKRARNDNTEALMDSSCWELYDRLASYRKEVSVSNATSAYIIAHNSLLRDLAIHRPSNEQELLQVPGVGKRKATDYGPSWLEIIANFQAEQEQHDGHVVRREDIDQVEGPDPKRRRLAQADRSTEDLLSPREAPPPPVLSTGLSFQFGETSLAEEAAVQPEPGKKDDGFDEFDDEDVDMFFGSPMALPSSLVLEQKRATTRYPNNQQSPSKGATNVPTPRARSPVPVINFSLKAPAAVPPKTTPTPVLPTTTAPSTSRSHPQTPSETPALEQTILRKKLEAYIKSVVWAMHLEPTERLVSEDTLRHLVTTIPRTMEEFRRIPGIQRLTRACEAVKMDVWRTFEKWTRGPGTG
ncbi:putative 3 -5 exonuclease helicase [Rosellinia necatrix]|uniref:Putative 3-5 exonuclease helicase n=1 Tax=Rosellinia necatrix TaxID=77044 RepID=A0A1W2TKI3_ROSNE|nr:putative 3 -5 exonuclease helicase [Rosellinia necatrix]